MIFSSLANRFFRVAVVVLVVLCVGQMDAAKKKLRNRKKQMGAPAKQVLSDPKQNLRNKLFDGQQKEPQPQDFANYMHYVKHCVDAGKYGDLQRLYDERKPLVIFTCDDGKSSLMAAIDKDYFRKTDVQIVDLLCKQADEFRKQGYADMINVPDHEGCTAAHYAAEKGNVDILKTLKIRGADFDKPNGRGARPIDLAANDDATDLIAGWGFGLRWSSDDDEGDEEEKLPSVDVVARDIEAADRERRREVIRQKLELEKERAEKNRKREDDARRLAAAKKQEEERAEEARRRADKLQEEHDELECFAQEWKTRQAQIHQVTAQADAERHRRTYRLERSEETARAVELADRKAAIALVTRLADAEQRRRVSEQQEEDTQIRAQERRAKQESTEIARRLAARGWAERNVQDVWSAVAIKQWSQAHEFIRDGADIYQECPSGEHKGKTVVQLVQELNLDPHVKHWHEAELRKAAFTRQSRQPLDNLVGNLMNAKKMDKAQELLRVVQDAERELDGVWVPSARSAQRALPETLEKEIPVAL